MPADIDPIQIAIIVIAMVAGFVQWLTGVMKQAKEERERPITPPDAEEKRLREEAWKKQTQQPVAPAPARPSPRTLPPAHDPWSSVRDIFEQIKKEVAEVQQPPAPVRPTATAPPQQPPPVRHPGRPVRTEMKPVPVVTPTPAAFIAPASAPVPPMISASQARGADFNGLRGLLMTPASLRHAVMLREILGPPKALQSPADSAF